MRPFFAKLETLLPRQRNSAAAGAVRCALMAGADQVRPGANSLGGSSMDLSAVVEVMARKAKAGFIVGMALWLALQMPSEILAQDGTDRVTGFARAPVHVAAWPGGKKVAVSFALF